MRKFKVWCDSGSNIHSRREFTVSLGCLGVTDEEWDQMSLDDRDEAMKDLAWDKLEWGYCEIE